MASIHEAIIKQLYGFLFIPRIEYSHPPMIIDMRSHRHVGSGVYADVFAVQEYAHKLFRSGPEVPPRQTKDGRRRVFRSQCEAFEIAGGDPWLRDHIAAFYGVCMVEDVLDVHGNSLKSGYLLDCCYRLELFDPGEIDSKTTTEWVRNLDHIGKALQRFTELGIAALDSSVFRYDDADKFKFIDIELRNCY
jgi:hypothetical protein